MQKFNTQDLRLGLPLEVKFAQGESAGIVEGLASPFGGAPDAYGDIIAPGAFSASLARHRAEGTTPAMLWAHDAARPVGRWIDLQETVEGLQVKGQFNLSTEAGREAFAHVEAGDMSGLSIGYRVDPGGAVETEFGGRELRSLDLFEISIVAIPAARSARVRGVKQLGSERDLVDLLTKSGIPRRGAEKIARGGFSALAGKADDEAAKDVLAALRELDETLSRIM